MANATQITPHSHRQFRYLEWLNTKGIKFNFASEIALLANRTKLGVMNDTPPVELWTNGLHSIHLLELVRARFGPTTVHSAYRSVAYNLAVGGVGDSQHTKNHAKDFSCETGSPAEWSNFLKILRDRGEFEGGIGVYRKQNFVHVDTRGTRADWVG